MIRVYIAGPYSKPDPAINVGVAMDVWHVLARAGLAPFCPHLSHFLHAHEPQEYEFWLAQDFVWVRACDVLVRIPGESSGADREVALAREIGLPVILWDDNMPIWPAVELRRFVETLAAEFNGGEGPRLMGIGSHTKPHAGRSVDWITPRHILEALGPFDLDPCASDPQPWPTARRMLTKSDDGLAAKWRGRIWLNPPYGPELAVWLERLAAHGCGTALIFARTETAFWFDHVWPRAAAICFLAGRLYFHYPGGTRARGNSGGPSALVAYGYRDAIKLKTSGLAGAYVEPGRIVIDG